MAEDFGFGDDDGSDFGGFENEDFGEEDFHAAADSDEEDFDSGFGNFDDSGGTTKITELSPAPEATSTPAKEDKQEPKREFQENQYALKDPTKSGWLFYQTSKGGSKTLSRKPKLKEYYFKLNDGKLSMHKMVNTPAVSTLDLPYCTILDDLHGADGRKQFILSTKKNEYLFQGKDEEYVNEWKATLKAAKKQTRRKSQYGRQTKQRGSQSEALLF
eukprot:m.338616 g.338616  ORF g.338616 m.338616 type:complete len:216 (+) comp18480_c0_seq1:133-780(+)